MFYFLEVSQIFVIALTIYLGAQTWLQMAIWKVMLPKPMLRVAQENTCDGVIEMSTDKGFPPCFILPWERDPAYLGIWIDFSEIAIASEGKDSRTLLQNQAKRAELLAIRVMFQKIVFKSEQPFLIKMIDMRATIHRKVQNDQTSAKPVQVTDIQPQ